MKETLTVCEMQEMQKKLFEKYGEKFGWQAYTPDNAKDHFLYMLGEAGEVIDCLKKDGIANLLPEGEKRRHFVEEMADTMMFFMDTLLCMNVTGQEFSDAYRAKHEKNMHRWDE